jgi:hypothetical protein
MQVFLVETVVLDGFACRLPVFRRKGRDRQNKFWEARLHGGRRY